MIGLARTKGFFRRTGLNKVIIGENKDTCDNIAASLSICYGWTEKGVVHRFGILHQVLASDACTYLIFPLTSMRLSARDIILRNLEMSFHSWPDQLIFV